MVFIWKSDGIPEWVQDCFYEKKNMNICHFSTSVYFISLSEIWSEILIFFYKSVSAILFINHNYYNIWQLFFIFFIFKLINRL